MPKNKQIEKLAKKFSESVNLYNKTRFELEKAERDIRTHDAAMKSGDPSKIGAATTAMSKLVPKLGVLHKRMDEARRKMEDANKALAKVA